MRGNSVKLVTFLGLLLAGAGHANAQAMSADEASPTPTPISHLNINYRQEEPTFLPSVTSTFSYDYWWPYPPGGVFATTSTGSAMLSSLSDSVPVSDETSTSITSPVVISDSTVVSVGVTTSSPSSSISIIHISALPPANSTVSLPQRHKLKPRSFKVIWLVPMFAVLGVVLGSLSAWFCYGCIIARRGPRTRASSLEPGPPYMATDAEIDDDDYYHSANLEKIALHDGYARKQTLHGRNHVKPHSNGSNSWLTRARSSRFAKLPPSSGGGGEMVDKFAWPEIGPTPTTGYFEHEEDPFLASSSRRSSTLNTCTKTIISKTPFSSRSASSSDPLSLLDLDECDEEDEVPFESLRHKSIRRGILDRLKFGTFRQANSSSHPELEGGESRSVLRKQCGMLSSSFKRTRATHHRGDSDFRVDDVKAPEKLYISADSPRKMREVVRRTGDETEWVEGSGFRIVEEHLDAIMQQVRGDNGEDVMEQKNFRSGQSSPCKGSFLHATPAPHDNYTHLPVRKAPLKTKVTRTQSGLDRIDSSILPLSPTQIMSPPLESKLFFTPILQQTDTGIRGNTSEPSNGIAARGGNSLALPRMMSEDGHRHQTRLLKSKPRAKDAPLPATPPRRTNQSYTDLSAPMTSRRSRNPHAGRGTPAERFAARQVALAKVEEVLSRSWSERALNPATFESAEGGIGIVMDGY